VLLAVALVAVSHNPLLLGLLAKAFFGSGSR
jgi:hypothetical protein